MTSPVSAIEAIARAVALDIYHNAVDSDDGSHSMDVPVAVALITDAMLPIARQAEALQWENAAKDERIALLRESLLGFEHACEQLAATRSHKIYTAMIDGGQAQELLGLDNARRRARALLGGENAGN